MNWSTPYSKLKELNAKKPLNDNIYDELVVVKLDSKSEIMFAKP